MDETTVNESDNNSHTNYKALTSGLQLFISDSIQKGGRGVVFFVISTSGIGP